MLIHHVQVHCVGGWVASSSFWHLLTQAGTFSDSLETSSLASIPSYLRPLRCPIPIFTVEERAPTGGSGPLVSAGSFKEAPR